MGGSSSKQAEKNGASLETIIGKTQLTGEGLPHSQRDAVRFFELAADADDDPVGMCELADCLMNGWGVEPDARRAYLLYKKAAEAPHCWPPAMHCVALCHRQGVGLNDPIEKTPRPFDPFGSLLESDKEEEEEEEEEVAQEKEEDTLLVPPEQQASEELAFNWFRKAATQDKEIAPLVSMYEVGMCYLYGLGCSSFPRRGVTWLNKAAVLEHEESQIALKTYYASIDLSPGAVDVLSVAALKHESWAENNLGVIAVREAMKSKDTASDAESKAEETASLLPPEPQAIAVGVTKEQREAREKAVHCFTAALLSSNNTMPEALLNLGVMYVRGWGGEDHTVYEGMTLIHRSATAGKIFSSPLSCWFCPAGFRPCFCS